MCNKKVGWIPDQVWDDKEKKVGWIPAYALAWLHPTPRWLRMTGGWTGLKFYDKRKKILVIVVFVILNLFQDLFFSSQVFPVLVGADNVALRQTSLITFPQVDVNNEIRGFTSVEAGFTLASATTTSTYNALMPVAGDVTFNNGRMHLNEDLFFVNDFRFMNGALIRGNGKALIFPSLATDITLPVSSGVVRLDNTNLDLNSNIILGGLWRIRGVCKIIGNGKTLTLGAGDLAIELGSGAQIEFQNVFLRGIGSSNLRCLTSNNSITLNDCTLSLSRDFTFSTGALLFKNDVDITGTSNFNYQSATASRILSGSTLYVNNGVSFNYAPVVANKNLLVMSDATSGLYLNGSSLTSTGTGLHLSTGTLYLENKVTLSSQALNSGEALEFDSTLNIQALAGAVLDVFGYVKYV